MADEYQYTDADAPPEDVEQVSESYDQLAEQSVVGAMLRDPRVIDDVIDEVTPGDFWHPKHELIARTIVGLHQRGLPADVIAVTEELARVGKLREAGDAVYLHELMDVPPTTANAGFYAAIVRTKAAMRRLHAAGLRITGMGQASEGEVEDLLERARRELDRVVTGRRAQLRQVGDTLGDVIDGLAQTPTYFRTPWSGLNKLVGGFAPGDLYVVAGRPGGGKSIVALQCAVRLAHEGMVAFSSLEMTEAELQKRLIAQYGPVGMSSLRTHQLSQADWERVAAARSAIQGAPIYVDDSPAVTLGQIRAHARAVARRGLLTGVVVDYLQLVRGEGESRQEVVAAVSRGLKELAKDLNVPVIAAAQLRRANARKPSDLPTLEDLRESGAIEQDADVVVLLHRDREKKPRDLQVVVAKNRHGESGRFVLDWQAEWARVVDREWSPLLDESEVA